MAYTPFLNPASYPTPLAVNQFSGAGGGTQGQQVISAYDIYKPNEMIEVFERHSYAPGFKLMLKAMGFNRGTAAPTTGHYEYPWKESLVQFGAITQISAGAGTDVIATIAPSHMYDAGVSVNGSSAKASYPRLNDILFFPDGNKGIIVAKDTTVDPHAITVRPVQAAMDLATSLVISTDYFISDNAHAEGSGLPTGRVPRVIKYSNTFQIVKEACSSSGSSMTNQTYFNPILGQPGSFYLKTKWDTMYRFECACDGALIWGTQIDNHSEFVADMGYDVDVTGTEGLYDFTTTNSITDVVAIGAYALADFDSITNTFEDERIGVRDLIHWQGKLRHTEIENLLYGELNNDLTMLLSKKFLNYGPSAQPNDGMQPASAADWALTIGFYGLRKGGYNHVFKSLHEFNKAVGAGSSAYNFKHWNVVMPIGYTTDKSTNENRATVGYEYKKLGNYSREEVVAELAGVGVAGTGTSYRIATSAGDIHRLGMVSEIAFHATCANHIILQHP